MAKKSRLTSAPIGPHTHVFVAGEKHLAIRPLSRGTEIKSVATGLIRVLTHDEYARGLMDGSVVVERIQGTDAFSGRPKHERRNVFLKQTVLTFLFEDFASGALKNTGEKELAAFKERHLSDVQDAMDAWEKTADYDFAKDRADKLAGKRKRKPYFGSATTTFELWPSNRWFRQHREWLVTTDRPAVTLRKRSENGRRGGKRVTPYIASLIEETANQFAGEGNTGVQKLTNLIKAKVLDHNTGLPEDAHERAPDWGTVKRAVERLPEGLKILGRKGVAALRKAIGPYGEGPTYLRVGELLEGDCWSVPLFTILNKHKLLGEVPPHLVPALEEAEKAQRLLLACHVDKTSGYIASALWGATESAELTVRALRMAVTDKSKYARWAGCKTDWSLFFGGEGGVTDGGPAYANNLYQSVANSVFERFSYAAGGIPTLRGLIESIFSTMHKGFIEGHVARSFQNVVAKGDYEPAERAVFTLEQFLTIFIRYLVDIYNNNVRLGGLRRSPKRECETIAAGTGVKLPPTEDEIRAWFGIDLTRKLGPHGVQVLYVEYDSAWLLHHRLFVGNQEVQVRVDEEDLGAISVLIDGMWITVPAKDPEFRGVSLEEWTLLLKDLRDRFGDEAEVDFREYIAPALLDIERRSREAEKAMKLDHVFWTEEMMLKVEDDLRVRPVNNTAPPEGPAPSFGAGTLGRRFDRQPSDSSTPLASVPPDPRHENESDDAPRRPVTFRED